MTDQPDTFDINFYQLTLSLHASAMQHMGKTMSPLTGKVERNLDMAKSSINMLEMLQKKTQGNLTEEEKKILERSLFELRINYVEESKKGDTPTEPEKTDTGSKEESSGPDDDEKSDKSAAEASEKKDQA